MLGQLAIVGQNTALVVLGGHLGPDVLGEVGVGTGVWNLGLMAMTGIQMAVSPSVAHRRGAGDLGGIGPAFAAAAWIGVVVGCLVAALLWWLAPLLIAGAGVVGVLQGGAVSVARSAAFALPALGLLLACRGLWEGCGWTRPTLAIGVLGLVQLVPVAWVLMYGGFGLPALGARGAGLAEVAVTWVDMAVALGVVWLARRRLGARGSFWPRRAEVAELLHLGIPMAGSVLLEVGLFSATGLLAARFGAVGASAHQVVLNLGSISFMVPLGLGLATTVRVGQAMGGRDREGARRAALAGMGLALTSQALSACLMLTVPRFLAGFYTADAGVAATSVVLLRLAAIFQLSDGLQVTSIGALRGLRDARVPVAITGFSYWCVGLPLGYVLAFPLRVGLAGLWIGIIAGLTVAAALLSTRFFRLLRHAR
ncbi:MAG: MATE family efflux transporter [Rhodospirillales bacterium]|nr:MATE family efflux transporter [Rhodospirillales bacterium]